MKQIFLAVFLLPLSAYSQNTYIDLHKTAVQHVLKASKSALESLGLEGSETLFGKDSEIIENGKVEGTYFDYIEHHIGSEQEHFKSFRFADCQVVIHIYGNLALATEKFIK